MIETKTYQFLVTTSPGLEGLLKEELESFGLEVKSAEFGLVRLAPSSPEVLATIFLRSRIGSKVNWVLKEFSARNPEMLYDQVRRIPWDQYLNDQDTFVVHAFGTAPAENLKLSFAPLKIKDAICDELKKLIQNRPNVSRIDPEVEVHAFFRQGRCELSLCLNVDALHMRGYRMEPGKAPLRENKAAALLKFLGYEGQVPLWDPFCGSGTIAIEAALIAQNIAPGIISKPKFKRVFRYFPDTEAIVEKLLVELKGKIRKAQNPIFASEFSSKLYSIAKDNAKRAGQLEVIRFEKKDALTVIRPDTLFVMNPPWGDRLDRGDANELLGEFVRHMKFESAPCRLGFVLEKGMEKALGLKPKKKLVFDNGPTQALFADVPILPKKNS